MKTENKKSDTYLVMAISFAMCVSFWGCTNTSKSAKIDEVLTNKWYNLVDSIYSNTDSISGVLLVAENGKIQIHKAKGFRGFIDKRPLEKNDIFELASLSKQFTAAAIMLLAQEGKLNYEDELQQYFPDLPYQNITIKHMLQHISGLPDYMELFYDYWDKSKVAGNTEIIDYLVKYHPPILFEPGEKYQYSNTGYVLLASIVEKVSGMDFIEFSNLKLFKPAALTNTAIRTKEEKINNDSLAWGYIYDIEQQKYMPADSFPYTDYATYLGNRKGPGRVSSNASDLLKWDQYLINSELFTTNTLQLAYSPSTLNNGQTHSYGFGWEVLSDNKGELILKHDGSNPGYKNTFIRMPNKQRAIILLTNNQPPRFNTIVETLVEAISK